MAGKPHASVTHDAWKALARQAGLALALGLLLWSPLPEILLGGWLEQSNDRRPASGRAHERRSLHELGSQFADTLGRSEEQRRREEGELSSLPSLRRFLLRYGEARMLRREFLGWYNGLPERLHAEVLSPEILLDYVYRGDLYAVDFSVTDRVAGQVTMRFIDRAGASLAERRVALDPLLLAFYSIEETARSEDPFMMDRGVLQIYPEEWLEYPGLLAPAAQRVITRLLLDQDLDLKRIFVAADGEIYCETVLGEEYVLYRVLPETREGDDEWNDLPGRGESAPGQPAGEANSDDEEERDWFGL